MKQVRVCVLLLIPVYCCSAVFSANGSTHTGKNIQDAVEHAVSAVRENSGNKLLEAEEKLTDLIKATTQAYTLNRTHTLLTRIQKLQTLLFWSRVFRESADIETQGDSRSGDTAPSTGDDGNNHIKVNPKHHSKENSADRDIGNELKKMLTDVLAGYKTGNEQHADSSLKQFFSEKVKKEMPNSARLAVWFVRDKEKTLFKMYREIGKMKDTKVFYTPPGSTHMKQGILVDIREETVQISSGPVTIGLPVLSLAPRVLVEAAGSLDVRDRLLLSFYMYLKSRPELGKAIGPRLKKESELNRLFTMIEQLIKSDNLEKLLKPYLAVIRRAERYHERGAYSDGFSECMKLSVLSDDQLVHLNRSYSSDTPDKNLLSLLESLMTSCKTCNGNINIVCPRCKGAGKMLEDDQGTFFEEARPSMKLITCKMCNGNGTIICPDCRKRRFDRNGLKMIQRLQQILLDSPEKKGEINDRSGNNNTE